MIEIDKTVSQIFLSEAGPCSSTGESNLVLQDLKFKFKFKLSSSSTRLDLQPRPCIRLQSKHHASSSVDTNIFSSCITHTFCSSPSVSNLSTIFINHPTFQTPKRSLFHGWLSFGRSLPRSLPPITPSKGHLQPMSATLPRHHRISAAREE